jgi:hypothetical protein
VRGRYAAGAQVVKVGIEVKDRREADAIRKGLDDPVTRAIVVVTGLLLMLPSKRARERVLTYVSDRLNEEEGVHQDARE